MVNINQNSKKEFDNVINNSEPDELNLKDILSFFGRNKNLLSKFLLFGFISVLPFHFH